MANLNKTLNPDGTSIRLCEVRFSYPRVFTPNPDNNDKYSCCILIDKKNTEAIDLFKSAEQAALKKGAEKFWKGKVPPTAHRPLHDGDEERPDDPAYKGMLFFNAANRYKPKVCFSDGGLIAEATEEDFYPGCYGAVTVDLYPYDSNGNRGVSASLGNLIKLRDGERLAGSSMSVEDSFGDIA